MNIELASYQDVEGALADKLRELLQSIPWLQNWNVQQLNGGSDVGFDLLAKVPLPGGDWAALCVTCKKDLRPSTFPSIINRAIKPPVAPKHIVNVLAMPLVTQRMADLCEENDWSWYDLAGNCHLNVPGAIYLERTGKEPVITRPRPSANLSTAEAARILRALLAPENAGHTWTQRELHAHCQPKVSLGLVNKVIRYLSEEAFAEKPAKGGVQLRDPLALLEVWQKAYRFKRHLRRDYFTLLQGKKLQEALAKLNIIANGRAAYAAFSAAEFQAPHVRQSKTWIFLGASYEDQFKSVAEAKSVDSGPNVVLLLPEDDGVFYNLDLGGSADRGLPCTNAVQTYIDLFHCHGRGEEAAQAILNQVLKPAWERARPS